MTVSHPPVNLLFDNLLLTIAPAPPGVEEVLTYVEKELQDVWKPGMWFPESEVVAGKIPLFSQLSGTPNIIQTYTGLLDRVVKWLLQHGYRPKMMDNRPEFPKPKLHLMHGFRFKQRELLTDFLMRGRSGMLRAPTRYGKTTLIINTLRAFPGVKTVVTVPGAELLTQLYDDIKKALPHREVKQIGGGSGTKWPSEDITVCSMDSLHRIDAGSVQLLLVDEPHACASDDRAEEFAKFDNARKYGYGATLIGRFDGRDLLTEALIGPMLVERSYADAVAEGAICPIVVYMLKVPFEDWSVAKRDTAYRHLLHRSPAAASLNAQILKDVLPAGWQALAFIANEHQANLYQEACPSAEIAMAKLMTKKERKAIVKRLENHELRRCICSGIFSTGVTFHELRAITMCSGGGGSITAIQKPGRVAEIRPGKKFGYVFDFIFEPTFNDPRAKYRDDAEWQCVTRDCWNRYAAYKDFGYEVHIVDSLEAARNDLLMKEAA